MSLDVKVYDSEDNALDTLYQWDANQSIKISGLSTSPLPDVHFCNENSDIALIVVPTTESGKLVAKIPNILLQDPLPIIAHIYYTAVDNGSRTKETVYIPVVPRTIPADYTFEENVDYYARMVARVMQAVSPVDTVVNLTPMGWEGSEAPYTYTKTVSGMTSEKTIWVAPDPSMNALARSALRNACVTCTGQSTDTLTFVADGIKPSRVVSLIVREVG